MTGRELERLTFIVLRRVADSRTIASRAASRVRLPRECTAAIEQETAIRVAKQIACTKVDAQNDEHLYAAFALTAMRVAQEIQRPERRRSDIVELLDPAGYTYASAVDPTMQGTHRLVRSELLRWLAGDAISTVDRRVLALAAHCDGAELANQLGKSEAAAYKALSRARTRVRAQIEMHFGATLGELLETEPIAA